MRLLHCEYGGARKACRGTVLKSAGVPDLPTGMSTASQEIRTIRLPQRRYIWVGLARRSRVDYLSILLRRQWFTPANMKQVEEIEKCQQHEEEVSYSHRLNKAGDILHK